MHCRSSSVHPNNDDNAYDFNGNNGNVDNDNHDNRNNNDSARCVGAAGLEILLIKAIVFYASF
jgi:hypothetical protein